jgi:hypothetical protein
LKNTDWIIVKDLVELLEKFAKVSEIISGEYYPTLSILFPCVEILKTHLKNSLRYQKSSLENTTQLGDGEFGPSSRAFGLSLFSGRA